MTGNELSESAVIGISLAGMALAALAIQNISKYTGKKLVLYILSFIAVGILGALMAHSSQKYAWPFGLLLGIAMVELAVPVGTAARVGTRKLLGRFFDKFSVEKTPGYSADEDDSDGSR